MPQLTISKKINAPVETVFRICSDFQNTPNTISAIKKIEMLTEGPTRVGTRFKETRIMFGKEATEEMEVAEFQPNRSFTLVADSCGCRYEMSHQFHREGNGTRLELDMNAKATSFLAKLMSPLSVLMMGTMKKAIDSDLDEVKRAAESPASPALQV
jgi:carbon monoxide dehydrogenase subunit G